MNDQLRLFCTVGGYNLTIEMLSCRLKFDAYSLLNGQLFEGSLSDDTLDQDLRVVYGQCRVIYSLLEEAAKTGSVVFGDNGELKFTVTIRMGSLDIQRDIRVLLEEVTVDEVKRLEMRVR